ncbi:S-layer homology domain-containing protein [Lysinibacillus sp. CNPSo 3705]|uniref:S-layer homology domain-containing protein n=1 Tax=Lysinibacillus sp. CNPSo 3705 TaxID=3028148 RepID=UPI0023647293|nr:S-layer homology domain-containing protein [Lysinibacillus sp. CNPSo 3705]MDD1504433.1 S-layer homology domain-containing protein [Lysinibacillus sp. CNPSo 3705]
MQTKQKKWWQRSLALMLSLVLIVSSFTMIGVPEKVQAAELPKEVYVANNGDDANGDGTSANPYATLNKAYSAIPINGEGTIYIKDDIEIGNDNIKYTTFNANKTVTLTSESSTPAVIQRTGNHSNASYDVIVSVTNGTIILKNIIFDGGAKELTPPKSQGRLINVQGNTAKLIIDDGTIIRNNITGNVIYMFPGTIKMIGGEIKENGSTTNKSGAIILSNAASTFEMTGGEITSNIGGGVDVNAGKISISGDAVITGNTKGEAEQNVYLKAPSLLTLDGNFTGKAGITAQDRMIVGSQFGQATEAGLKGLGNLYADNNPDLFAAYDGANSLIWGALALTSPTGTVTTGKPTFTGTAAPGSEVTVKVGDITLTATADADGNWSVTPSTNIPDGVYKVGVTALKGETYFGPVTKEITIDTKQYVDYVEVSEVTEILPNSVTYDSSTGKFTVPTDLDSFTFKDGTKQMQATKEKDGTWVFTEVPAVDKTALQAKVAAGLNESDYTTDTWAAYEKELAKAQAVLGNANATQAEVDKALVDLTTAQQALQKVSGVDKAPLQAKVDEAKGLVASKYTPETWANYQNQLKAAQAVLDDVDATQTEVDAAREALTVAQDKLQKVSAVNKALLQAKVDEAKGLVASKYTPETWANYQNQLKAAQAVLDDEDATQTEVEAAREALTAAQDKLQKVSAVDKALLQAKVDEAKGLDASKYMSETWANYQNQLKAAQAVLDDEDATQTEVDAAREALIAAQDKLQKVSAVNKALLQAKVDEAKGLVASKYTPETWANYQNQLKAAQKVLDNANATQAEVDQALADLTAAKNALRPALTTPGLGSLVPSQGVLSPSFSSEVTNYTMNVDYATSQLSFLATTINPGASVTTTVNGQPGTLEQIPLQVGENVIVITVTESNGDVRHYTIKVYREAYTGGGGGGGTWTPNPTPPTTTEPGTTTTKIKVALEIDGNNPLEKTTVEIERTKHASGEITDFVALTEANAQEAVEKAQQIGNNIARIVIPDVKDEVDKITVEIPKHSLKLLRENGLSLEIATENGLIAIPLSSMNGVDDNFYFRLVPVKKESERKAIEERARVEKVVRESLQSKNVRVVARPMTIETNMPSRPVQVTLPLKDLKVPTASAERQVFLDQLAVFIEHSDGEKKVVFPEMVTMPNGELGLRFIVDKFSTFTVIQFEKLTVSKHEAYIKGFPNGTFGPEKNVTRAQVATMIARILGYTDDQTVDYAPFKDIPSNHYAAGAIAFVKERGIMNGDMNGNFRANENITRAQMATVVANYKHLQIEEDVELTFNDTKGHWAQWIIEANRIAGIINGRQDGSFAPDEHLTRAQAVVMMNRMFERGPLHGVTKPSFLDTQATHWAFNEIEEAANAHAYIINEDGEEHLSK